MTKSLGRVAALAGLLASAWMVWHDHPRTVLALLRSAGWGLLAAGAVHLLAMTINARAWQTLVLAPRRPPLGRMLHLVWLRESVNGLLPVARVGGEMVSFRRLRAVGVGAPAATASLLVDVQLAVLGQLLFTLLGVGYLFTRTNSSALRLAGELAWGAVALAPLLALFAMIQHVRPFERVSALLNRLTNGKLDPIMGQSAAIDRQMKRIWRHRGIVLGYLLCWYPLQCFGTALEIWVALKFLGVAVTAAEALVFEALIQAASSAAFFVPGGLGVQEGAFVLVGQVFGLDPAVSLALAGARRVRDLLIFLPGLVAWQISEA